MTFVLCFAMFTKSLPLLCENSTAYTTPSDPTTSATWDTVVPLAAPKYNTFAPGFINISLIPPITAAAIFDRYGFHTLYSILSLDVGSSIYILFSLYTLSPGYIFFVTKASY